jgi:hypothetical protein
MNSAGSPLLLTGVPLEAHAAPLVLAQVFALHPATRADEAAAAGASQPANTAVLVQITSAGVCSLWQRDAPGGSWAFATRFNVLDALPAAAEGKASASLVVLDAWMDPSSHTLLIVTQAHAQPLEQRSGQWYAIPVDLELTQRAAQPQTVPGPSPSEGSQLSIAVDEAVLLADLQLHSNDRWRYSPPPAPVLLPATAGVLGVWALSADGPRIWLPPRDGGVASLLFMSWDVILHRTGGEDTDGSARATDGGAPVVACGANAETGRLLAVQGDGCSTIINVAASVSASSSNAAFKLAVQPGSKLQALAIFLALGSDNNSNLGNVLPCEHITYALVSASGAVDDSTAATELSSSLLIYDAATGLLMQAVDLPVDHRGWRLWRNNGISSEANTRCVMGVYSSSQVLGLVTPHAEAYARELVRRLTGELRMDCRFCLASFFLCFFVHF